MKGFFRFLALPFYIAAGVALICLCAVGAMLLGFLWIAEGFSK